MNLSITRKIIDEIHSGNLEKIPTKVTPLFGLNIPESCPGVPSEILDPRQSWPNKVRALLGFFFFLLLPI